MAQTFVVTHPEASHHVADLVGGWYDSHLTARGLDEAAQIGRHLRGIIADDVPVQLVSSDLQRTRQTADAIGAALGIQPVVDQRLREKSYGVAEGRPQRWLDERFVFPPSVGERLDHDEGIEDGETKREWAERVYAAMADIESERADVRVIVTHGGTANWVVAAWMRLPIDACAYAAFRIPSGSVTLLDEDDRFHNRTLAVLGDRSFLAGL